MSGSATLDGGRGNDILRGGRGNDSLTGDPGDDRIFGNGGLDTLVESGDANMVLTNSAFRGGTLLGSDVLSGIEQARLTGGIHANVINASLFSLGSVFLDGGPGNDRLTGGTKNDFLTGGTSADVIGGGAGFDTVRAAGAGSFILRSTSLSVAGVQDSLSGVERADLTGSAGRDVFNVSSWERPASFAGAGGADLFVLSRGGSIALSNSQVRLSASVAYTLSGIEEASLVGGRSNDRFTVSGWTGTATLNGSSGIDTVVASGNANFILTNGLLTRSTGGTFNLRSIERAILQGGSSANVLDASGFSAGGAVLVGLSGNDKLMGGSGRDILIGGLGADILQANGADDILIGGFTTHDSNVTALDLLMQEWSRTDAGYSLRRDHLLGTRTGGRNSSVRLNRSTVRNDIVVDPLTGGLATDWFLALAAELTDRNSRAETLTLIP